MSCPSFETLSAEVDGALAETEAAAVAKHLPGCDRCRARRAELLLLKATVRGGVRSDPASAALKERLTRTAARAPVLARRRRWVLIAGAAAVVLCAALGAFVWLRPRPVATTSELFAMQLVGDHVLNALNHEKPLEVVSSDPATVERWFAGKLDFAVKLPAMPGATLAGGRLCSVGGKRVALLFYDRDGHRMSLFVMDAEAAMKHRPCEADIQGFTVCRHLVHGLDYALVTDLPPEKAEPLLRSSL